MYLKEKKEIKHSYIHLKKKRTRLKKEKKDKFP